MHSRIDSIHGTIKYKFCFFRRGQKNWSNQRVLSLDNPDSARKPKINENADATMMKKKILDTYLKREKARIQ